jgi:hypothetical protein
MRFNAHRSRPRGKPRSRSGPQIPVNIEAAMHRVIAAYKRPDSLTHEDPELDQDLITIMAHWDPARFVFMSALYGPREEPSSTDLKSEEDE